MKTARRTSSPAQPAQFDHAELHATRVTGDQVRMQRVEAVEVPAHDSVRFEPGGYHLTLIRPRQPLQASDSVTLTLQFKGTAAVTGRRSAKVINRIGITCAIWTCNHIATSVRRTTIPEENADERAALASEG